MMCKCVGREQGAQRFRGGGDAMGVNCRGRAAKDVSPLPRFALFAFERELMNAEGCPLHVPRLVGASKAIPVGALFGEATRSEERAGGNCGESHVIDGEVCSNGLIFSVLEEVDVLGNARVIGPPAEHGGQEGDNFCDLEAAAAVLEAVEEVAEGGLVVKGRFLLEGGIHVSSTTALKNVCPARSTVLTSRWRSILAVQRRLALARTALVALPEMPSS